MKLPINLIISTIVAPIIDMAIEKYMTKQKSMTVVHEKSKEERRYELQNLIGKGRPSWYSQTEWEKLVNEYEKLKTEMN